jgi:hypothetical protein
LGYLNPLHNSASKVDLRRQEMKQGQEVICVCGKRAPVVLITEQEPDAELRENYFGKKIVKCSNCMTATEVTEKLQRLFDDAEKMGKLSGCPAPLVVLDAKEDEKTGGE